MSDKPVIFISFSHLDEPEPPGPGEVAWLTFVQSFLAPLVVAVGIFDIWVDFHLHGGDKIDPEIEQKLAACDIFVLLVSRHSLASTYVVKTEIATIHARQENGEDVHIFPIALSPVPKAALALLQGVLLKPDIKRPLSLMPQAEREAVMAAIADDIAAVADKLAEKKREPAQALNIKPSMFGVEIDVAAVTNRLLRGAGLKGPHAIVDTTRLPETAYERLVGRDAELKRLDEAWADNKTNILSLIAEGGAGKSALANEWLTRLQVDSYRGAEAVLGWSFYSQGSKERATSAEGFLNWALDKLGIKLETTSTSAKGEAIAGVLAKRRILLVLDGVEPLQHGPGPQVGQLKDLGLRSLLRRFAFVSPAETHGLVVLTSRLAVTDVARWKDTAAPVVDVERLSDEAGAALLRDNGVWGTDSQLQTAAREFGGHPLALALLATFLKETQFGDVRRRDRVHAFVEDDDNPLHAHAGRMMASYEDEWLKDQPVLLAVLHVVGLFDRPASGDYLVALRREPFIEGLTNEIAKLNDGEWARAVARLREVRLLAPIDPSDPNALDAHPLVREWFGERLRQANETAWRAAHGRLYEHLRDMTKEGKTPTLEDLAPLYQAIAHGCRAGRHQEALHDIYQNRICRRHPDSRLEFYASAKLGAIGSDLAAISWFFEKSYERPVATLRLAEQVWVVGQTGLRLRTQGRFVEALPTLRATLRMCEVTDAWTNAAISASNLSETELLVGEVTAAVGSAEKCVAHADRSGDEFWAMGCRTTLADALHAAGRREEVATLFADAERRQKQRQPASPLLYSVQGYRYCDLLLAEGDDAAARDRSNRTILIARRNNWLLDIALDTLTLGRASVRFALADTGALRAAARDDARAARSSLDEVVDGLRAASAMEFIPRGLLARAAFLRSIGDWDGAARDLDEVEEIAEPGPMRLYLCDMALERARLAFAQIEAFAPLNGMLEKDNPPKPEVPGAEEIAKLKAEAEKQIKIADEYIQSCGYHRRDEELAELYAVLRGERTFASLPPRV